MHPCPSKASRDSIEGGLRQFDICHGKMRNVTIKVLTKPTLMIPLLVRDLTNLLSAAWPLWWS